MDFFARQEDARRGTRWLVVLFALAVAGVVAAVNLAVVVMLLMGSSSVDPADLFRPGALGSITAVTLTIVGASSL